MLKDIRIHIIPHAHADYAWTHSRQWHEERYLLIINEVIELLEKNPELTWMLDNINHILAPFLKYYPEYLERFKRLVNEARLEITNGTYSLVRPTQVGEETFIRNIVLGKRFFKTMFPEMDIHVFHNVDVSIGHSQLPQVLKLCGYLYYRAWRPQGALDGKKIPGEFMWKGLDGTVVVCSRGSYAGLCGLDYMNGDFENNWDELRNVFYTKELQNLVKRSNVPIIWLSHGMDDSRLLRDYTDKPADILGFIREWKKREDIPIRFSTAESYFEDVTRHELKGVEGVLDGCDTAYNTPQKGDKGLWRLREEMDRLIVKAEIIWSFATISGEPYPEEKLMRLWEILLCISGHAMEFTLAPDYEKLYFDALSSIHVAKELISEAKFRVASKVEPTDGKQIIVFNTTNWERMEAVPVHVSFPEGGKDFYIKDYKGKVLEHQICSSIKGDISYGTGKFDDVDIIVQCTVPPMGYTALTIVDKGKEMDVENFGIQFEDIDFKLNGASAQVVNTGEIIVEFSEGRIVSISDAVNENLLNCYKGSRKFNEIRFTEVSHHANSAWLFFSHFQSVQYFTEEKWYWEEFGDLRWKYAVIGRIGKNRVKQEIILYKGKRHIDFNVDIECHDRQTGFFSAAFPVDNGSEITADIPFGIEKRELNSEAFGKTTDNAADNIERLWKGLFFAKSWVNYKCYGMRHSVVGDTIGHYYLHDDRGGTISTILTRTYDLSKSTDWFKAVHPYSECIGLNNFKYSLFIHNCAEDGFLPVIRLAREKAMKLEMMTKLNRFSDGETGLEKEFFHIDCPSAVVTAVHSHENGYIIRLYESKGKSSELKIRTPYKLHSATRVDLMGNIKKGGRITVDYERTAFKTVIKPWEIASFFLQFHITDK